ncbi:oxidoreductase [Sphingomonas panacis]|uniref:Oxidoreductase n=1 Tax=Sphingomonas panacis TaxID=1560345 RepID=A0A1B3ZG94_9SPHN|nr:NAD(P)-dependent oxidoreductase [Sphingomonas panacis]AOH86431.1 oxidoreductase [Sphingomonas panacis]
MTDTSVLGFVGLGSMGSAMAPHLVTAGHDVVAFDTAETALAAFTDAGGRRADSATAVAEQAGIVFISLPSPQIVQDVALALVPGKPRIVIDLSTTGPRMSKAVADALGEAGITLVDAPVSGGRGGALAGKLSLMVACPKTVWDEVAPLLATFGKTFHVGETPGQAQTMKLVNNALSVAALAATCEGMAMGVKAGLDPQVMLDVFNASSGRNSATTDKFPRAVLPRTFDFGFATQLSLKDMRLCLDEAEAMGVPMMMSTTARTMLNITQARFGGASDFTEMAKVVEQWAGVEIGGK